MAGWRDGARRHRQFAVEEDRIRDAADMPQLRNDATARSMDGIGDLAPAGDLFIRPDTGCVGIAHALRRDRGRLGENEPCAGALDIIVTHQIIGDAAFAGTRAGQWRQDDAIRQVQIAGSDRLEKLGHEAYLSFL